MKTKKKNRVWISARISPESHKILVKKAKKFGSKGLALDDLIEAGDYFDTNYSEAVH